MPVEALRGIPWTLLTYASTRVRDRPDDACPGAAARAGRLRAVRHGDRSAWSCLSVFSGLWLGAALIVRPDLDRRAEGTVLSLVTARGRAARRDPDPRCRPRWPPSSASPGSPASSLLLAAVLLVSGVNWFYETLLQRELAFRPPLRLPDRADARLLGRGARASPPPARGSGAWWAPTSPDMSPTPQRCWLLDALPGAAGVRPRGGAGASSGAAAASSRRTWPSSWARTPTTWRSGASSGRPSSGSTRWRSARPSCRNYAIAEPVGKVTFPAFAQMQPARGGRTARVPQHAAADGPRDRTRGRDPQRRGGAVRRRAVRRRLGADGGAARRARASGRRCARCR